MSARRYKMIDKNHPRKLGTILVQEDGRDLYKLEGKDRPSRWYGYEITNYPKEWEAIEETYILGFSNKTNLEVKAYNVFEAMNKVKALGYKVVWSERLSGKVYKVITHHTIGEASYQKNIPTEQFLFIRN